jgi:hypothetical protein
MTMRKSINYTVLRTRIWFFPDPGFQTHIFDSVLTNFWIKSTIILSVLALKKILYLFKNKIIYNFMIRVAKNGRTKIFSPASFDAVFACLSANVCIWPIANLL